MPLIHRPDRFFHPFIERDQPLPSRRVRRLVQRVVPGNPGVISVVLHKGVRIHVALGSVIRPEVELRLNQVHDQP